MYPNSSSNHSAHPQLWQQEDGNDQGRHSASEPGAYPPPPPPPSSSSSQAPRGPQPGYLREDSVRDERYGPREDAYRYPPREDDYRPQALPPPLGLAPGGPPQHPGPPILPQVSHLGPDPHAMGGQDLYRGQQDYPRMTHSHNPHNFVQPAPRQRTAIACRYCRRRKIRCSGFESSADGRCSNCQRFNQECIFTPVSSQTQAFVPAHTHYPELRQTSGGRGGARQGYPPRNVQLFGAFGEPIPTSSLSLGSTVDYPGPPYGGRGPSPTPHQGQHQPPYEQLSYDPGQRPGHDGSAPVLPPLPRRSSQGDPVQWNRIDQASSPPILPPPHNAASATTHSYGESAPSTFYPPGTQNRRTSPPAFVGGDRPSSISPHPVVHPPMWPEPPRPGSTGPAGPKLHPMQLSNIIDQSTPQQRSAHDNEMLNQLKRGL